MANALQTDPKKRKTHTLTDIVTDEISLVPEGAIGRRFVFKKENSTMTIEKQKEMLLSLFEVPILKEADLDAWLTKEGMDEETQDAIKNAIRVLQPVEDKLPEGLLPKLGELLGMPGAAVEQEAVAAEGDDKGEEEETEKAEEEEKEEEEMTKEMSELAKDFDAKLAKMNEDNVKLAKKLHDEQEIRKNREYLDEAADYTMPDTTTEALAKQMRQADDAGFGPQFRDQCAAVTGIYKESKMFQRIGKGNAGDATSATAKFTKLQKELKSKNPTMADEQILVMATDVDPELAEAFHNEDQ